MMWTKPYDMREGFLIGGGLIFAGLMLELSVGPVDWDAFRWPVNGIVLAGFLAIIAVIFLSRKRVFGLQFIGTYKAAIPALVYAVVLTIIMGLTRQESLTPGPSPMGEGSLWINHMLNFWPFVLIYAYIAVILGQIILRRIINCQLSILNLKRDIPFLLNHLGLFLAMITATLGSADMQRLKMITVKGEPEWRALTSQQQIVEMPIAMLFGALWAKEAWGHYWSWDPKETWAAITWFAYLVYIHYRQIPTHKPRLALWVLIISFILLQMCWWGINYLPAAQGSSVHVYSMPS